MEVHAQKSFTNWCPRSKKFGDPWPGDWVGIFTENLCYSSYLEEAHLEGLLSVKNVIRVGFALPTVFCAKDKKKYRRQK